MTKIQNDYFLVNENIFEDQIFLPFLESFDQSQMNKMEQPHELMCENLHFINLVQSSSTTALH